MKDAINCLSTDVLEQLTHDEIAPNKLADIEQHVSRCQHCRHLLDGVTLDPQWREDIRPVLQETIVAKTTNVDFDGRTGDASILRLLGPTDDPHMLGRIGAYEVVGIIGQGGMGVVFKAYDTALDRFVAIKMLLPHLAANGAARRRFSREAQAVAAVVDDHVLPIYGVDEWQEIPYIVMHYSRGTTLQKRIEQQGPLGVKEILRVALQTARGLAAAHAQGLVHRDVKPANILLDSTVERAVLTDFGLARAADDASITRTGSISGTPQFMSPEQVRGALVDARSDLFSLGSTMYAMCTGRSPFRSETAFGVMHRLIHDQPRPICEINPEVPFWLADIVGRLISKAPHERFESAVQVAALLEECLAHVQQPTNVPLPEACESLQRQTASQTSRRGPFFRFPVFRWIATFAFFVIVGTVILLELNKGTLRIESELDDVSVRVMRGERVVKELTVSRAGTAVRIAVGEYIVEIEGETDDIAIRGGTITLTRGSTKVASIVHVKKPAKQDFGEKSHGRFRAVVEKRGEESGSLQMRAFVDKPMIGLVRVGYPARIKIDALPTVICGGRVTAIINETGSPRNGVPGAAYQAIITFNTMPKMLLAGMTGEVDIESPTRRNTEAWNNTKAHADQRHANGEDSSEPKLDSKERTGVQIEVLPDTGVMILRGERKAVDRTAKVLSDILEESTKDESKQGTDTNRAPRRENHQ